MKTDWQKIIANHPKTIIVTLALLAWFGVFAVLFVVFRDWT